MMSTVHWEEEWGWVGKESVNEKVLLESWS